MPSRVSTNDLQRDTMPRVGVMLETTLGVLLVAAIVFAVVVVVTGRADMFTEVPPDGRPRSAPVDRPVTSEDIKAVTFDMAVRGYRMAEVDQYLERVAHDIAFRDERILGLQAELEAAREGRSVEPGQLEPAAESGVVLDKAAANGEHVGESATTSATPADEVAEAADDAADNAADRAEAEPGEKTGDEVDLDATAADELPRWAG